MLSRFTASLLILEHLTAVYNDGAQTLSIYIPVESEDVPFCTFKYFPGGNGPEESCFHCTSVQYKSPIHWRLEVNTKITLPSSGEGLT